MADVRLAGHIFRHAGGRVDGRNGRAFVYRRRQLHAADRALLNKYYTIDVVMFPPHSLRPGARIQSARSARMRALRAQRSSVRSALRFSSASASALPDRPAGRPAGCVYIFLHLLVRLIFSTFSMLRLRGEKKIYINRGPFVCVSFNKTTDVTNSELLFYYAALG